MNQIRILAAAAPLEQARRAAIGAASAPARTSDDGSSLGRLLLALEQRLDARRDDQAAEDAGQQRIRAQPIGPVILIVALADGVQIRNVRDLVLRRADRQAAVGRSARSRTTARPSSSAPPGKSSSASSRGSTPWNFS